MIFQYNELLDSPFETKQWTKQFSCGLIRPSLVILSGELGTGKTLMAQQIGLSLGINQPMTSPSFSLMNYYPIHQGCLLHLDVYRLSSLDELSELGIDDFFDMQSILLVEWGEQFLDYWKEWIQSFQFQVEGWHIQLLVKDENQRQLKGYRFT